MRIVPTMLRRSTAVLLFALSAPLCAQDAASPAAVPASALPAAALPGPVAALPPGHFAHQRDALRLAVGDGVILLRGAGKPASMGAFGQDQDFLYLSGVEEPDLAMLLAPARSGGDVVDELLVPPFSRFEAQWNGEFLAPGAAAAQRTGFATVGNVRQLQQRLEELLAAGQDGKRPVLWTVLTPEPGPGGTPGSAAGAVQAQRNDVFDGRPGREDALKDKLAALFPGVEIKDLTPLLHRQRLRKTDGEIALLRASAAIAAAGHVEAMRRARPGMFEYQLAAAARCVFSLCGAGPDAYGAIVGAGRNGCVLHYMRNSAALQDGDLVVMDYAATVHGYASDVTRTFPANGTFTPAQRQLVQDIWEIQQALLAEVRPGAKLSQLGRRCEELLLAHGYRSEHGPCHHVGLAVHDPSADELQAGMVITVEPGAYLRDRGMGCRIEDTVLVTERGCEVLSAAAPSAPADVERLMAGKAALAR